VAEGERALGGRAQGERASSERASSERASSERALGERALGGRAQGERADLGAMVVRLGRRLIAMEQPILERHGVTMWAYVVLTALRDGPARAQAALAASIGADKTRLIPVLDDLQRRGLIEREPDPADRRARLLGLTEAGERVQRAVQAEIREEEAALLSGIEDGDAFVRALRALS
jgi:DNA-binding MarR family transcriptional regulator